MTLSETDSSFSGSCACSVRARPQKTRIAPFLIAARKQKFSSANGMSPSQILSRVGHGQTGTN
jgi:hypothetical protein